jgi:hypothetical protein
MTVSNFLVQSQPLYEKTGENHEKSTLRQACLCAEFEHATFHSRKINHTMSTFDRLIICIQFSCIYLYVLVAFLLLLTLIARKLSN